MAADAPVERLPQASEGLTVCDDFGGATTRFVGIAQFVDDEEKNSVGGVGVDERAAIQAATR
jgi:hypothetical protein